jgi:hypothetical protein
LGSILLFTFDTSTEKAVTGCHVRGITMQTLKHTESDEQRSQQEQSRKDALKQCDELIAHFKRKSREGKRVFQTFKYSSVILTIVVTVLSAIEGMQQWIIPVFSGLAVLATTMLSATNAQELWLESRTTQQQVTSEPKANLPISDRSRAAIVEVVEP